MILTLCIYKNICIKNASDSFPCIGNNNTCVVGQHTDTHTHTWWARTQAHLRFTFSVIVAFIVCFGDCEKAKLLQMIHPRATATNANEISSRNSIWKFPSSFAINQARPYVCIYVCMYICNFCAGVCTSVCFLGTLPRVEPSYHRITG